MCGHSRSRVIVVMIVIIVIVAVIESVTGARGGALEHHLLSTPDIKLCPNRVVIHKIAQVADLLVVYIYLLEHAIFSKYLFEENSKMSLNPGLASLEGRYLIWRSAMCLSQHHDR